jgi:ATP phosphoribosyltransferase regulatory subunit
MTDTPIRALLPAGLRDTLPPEADHEADLLARVMACFGAHGYDRVIPPLVEFEETLLDGAGAATAAQCFRVMDPLTQKTMAVRADMTPQVARIALARLAGQPRPLRLCYAGDVLRVKGSQLSPERQFTQAGLEVIGSASAAADAEVLSLGAEALAAIGIDDISVDLSLPTLVPAVLDSAGVPVGPGRDDLMQALSHRDAAAVAALGGAAAPVLGALLGAVGPLQRALAILMTLPMPQAAADECKRLERVAAVLADAVPGLVLTVDPVESRGFEYHSGLAFTLFSRSAGVELGRGGRYVTGDQSATGLTLEVDSLLAVAPAGAARRRVYVPVGTPRAAAAQARAEGWVTVAGLEAMPDAAAEARRLGCGYVLADTGILPAAEG